ASKRVNLIPQLALKKSPELTDVPLIFAFAANDQQRQILRLVLSRQSMARPFAAPPALPEERKAALRQAFDRTFADPEFLAEAKQRGLEVNPVSGAEIDKLVGELYQTPPETIAETRAILGEGARQRRHVRLRHPSRRHRRCPCHCPAPRGHVPRHGPGADRGDGGGAAGAVAPRARSGAARRLLCGLAGGRPDRRDRRRRR